MKNRLEVAKELLRDDGVIFVQCDDNEQAYLKVLMDELFKSENFISTMIYKKRKTQANLTKFIASIHDYIIMFSKNKNQLEINRVSLREEYVKDMYKNPDNDPRGLWMTKPLASPDNAPNKEFELDLKNGRKITAKWRVSQETYNKWLEEKLIVIPNNGKGMPRAKIFLEENQGQIQNSLLIDIATNEQGSKEIENLFGSNGVFSFPKPEALIQRIIEISTSPNDIVLDFFAGSGTTGAVAHKMNRQWIMIEQMDYIENITKERLKKVLEGEQGGISKSVDWKGGGDFVYFELKKYALNYIEEIEKCETSEQLFILARRIIDECIIRIDVKDNKILNSETEFKKLELEDQKYILKSLIDKNYIYVNCDDSEDIIYGVNDEEKKISKDFFSDQKK